MAVVCPRVLCCLKDVSQYVCVHISSCIVHRNRVALLIEILSKSQYGQVQYPNRSRPTNHIPDLRDHACFIQTPAKNYIIISVFLSVKMECRITIPTKIQLISSLQYLSKIKTVIFFLHIVQLYIEIDCIC